MTPIRFFPYFVSNPDFPPTDESTIARSVVGICTTLTPLRYVAPANAVMSPTTPPPNATITSLLVTPILLNSEYI